MLIFWPVVKIGQMNSLECDSKVGDADDQNLGLAEKIFRLLVDKYDIERLMKIVEENRDKNVYVVVSRDFPEDVRVVADSNGKYACGSVLAIPVPKKFVLLEPDRNYFEQTLKANIFLALSGADEKDLHR